MFVDVVALWNGIFPQGVLKVAGYSFFELCKPQYQVGDLAEQASFGVFQCTLSLTVPRVCLSPELPSSHML